MATKEENKARAERIKKITSKIKQPAIVKEPSLYRTALGEMSRVVWIPINDDLSPSKMAFVTITPSNAYKVFVNRKIPKKYHKQFKLHEFGHILFGHLQFDEQKESAFTKRVLQHWPQIEQHIELDPEDVGKSKVDLADKYILPLRRIFENYAEDMEVNSKLFVTKEERKSMIENTGIAYMLAQLNDPLVLDAELDNIEEYLNNKKLKKQSFVKPIYPADYDFPDQLSYREYIDLIFANIDKFMNLLKDRADGMSSDSDGNDKEQAGDSDGNNGGSGGLGGLSDEDKKRLAKKAMRDGSFGSRQAGKKLTSKDIEKLRMEANASDTDLEANEEEAKKTGHGGEINEEGNIDEDEDEGASGYGSGGEDGEGGDWSGTPGLGFGHLKKVRPDVIPLGDGTELAKFIEKQAFSKKITNTRENIMYYYNRRKYGEKDIISKQTYENLYRPGNIYIVVDCSGSIAKKAIRTMLAVIRKVSKKCGPRSRVIWWDTGLCGDFSLKTNHPPIAGGGTDIAGGIQYVCSKYLKKSNDKIIIISDYCDTLNNWVDVLKKYPNNEAIGIGWTYGDEKSTDSFIMSANWGDTVRLKAFKNRITTKVVRIDKNNDWNDY